MEADAAVSDTQVYTREKEGGTTSSSSSAVDNLGMPLNAFFSELRQLLTPSWGLYFKMKVPGVFMELLIWTATQYITHHWLHMNGLNI